VGGGGELREIASCVTQLCSLPKWDAMLHGVCLHLVSSPWIEVHRRFGGSYCLHFRAQSRNKAVVLTVMMNPM
jgi:hypothetical protein